MNCWHLSHELMSSVGVTAQLSAITAHVYPSDVLSPLQSPPLVLRPLLSPSLCVTALFYSRESSSVLSCFRGKPAL